MTFIQIRRISSLINYDPNLSPKSALNPIFPPKNHPPQNDLCSLFHSNRSLINKATDSQMTVDEYINKCR